MKRFYPVAMEDWSYIPKLNRNRLNVCAVPTGEQRNPKKGEWFLSGAEVEAYYAPNDLSSSYHIAKLVKKVEHTTYTFEEI